MVAVIDRLLFNPVTITFNGKQTVVTDRIEAIVLQPVAKGSMEGEAGVRPSAAEVSGVCSSKCEEPARGHRFLDSDYTRSLANWTEGEK